MASKLLIVLLSWAALNFCASSSLACTCVPLPFEPGKCPHPKPKGILFIGTVIDVQPPPDHGRTLAPMFRYRFRVEEKIVGMDDREVDVYSGLGNGDCGYHFEVGKKYFVNPEKQDGRLVTGICSDTHAIEEEPQSSEAPTGEQPYATLAGIVRATNSDGSEAPRPGVVLVLRGPNGSSSLATDRDGAYRFKVPAGTYNFVGNYLGPGLKLVQPSTGEPLQFIDLAPKTCYEQDLVLIRKAPYK